MAIQGDGKGANVTKQHTVGGKRERRRSHGDGIFEPELGIKLTETPDVVFV